MLTRPAEPFGVHLTEERKTGDALLVAECVLQLLSGKVLSDAKQGRAMGKATMEADMPGVWQSLESSCRALRCRDEMLLLLRNALLCFFVMFY